MVTLAYPPVQLPKCLLVARDVHSGSGGNDSWPFQLQSLKTMPAFNASCFRASENSQQKLLVAVFRFSASKRKDWPFDSPLLQHRLLPTAEVQGNRSRLLLPPIFCRQPTLTAHFGSLGLAPPEGRALELKWDVKGGDPGFGEANQKTACKSQDPGV